MWVLNQTGIPHQLNTKTRSPSQQPPPPLPFPCTEPKPQPLVNGTSDKPAASLPDSIRSSIKHGNINYQPTRTNTFLNKTKSKEAKSRATPVTANHNLLDVRNTAPVTTSPVTRGRSALRKNKTYIPSSPVSHTSFVFQDLDPNIINGHKPSARLSPRRFYNEYPNENRVPVPPMPKLQLPPQPPYDKICGGDNDQVCLYFYYVLLYFYFIIYSTVLYYKLLYYTMYFILLLVYQYYQFANGLLAQLVNLAGIARGTRFDSRLCH